MNQIAQQLKERNIAEYLIYMWQEEDLIRANHCEPEELETNVIGPLSGGPACCHERVVWQSDNDDE